MTNITYTVTDKEFEIEVKGHAGYAAMGNDIVCAAISILIQTLMLHIDTVTDRYEAWAESGHAYIWGYGKEAVASFHTIETGLISLAAQYENFLQLEEGCTIKNESHLK